MNLQEWQKLLPEKVYIKIPMETGDKRYSLRDVAYMIWEDAQVNPRQKRVRFSSLRPGDRFEYDSINFVAGTDSKNNRIRAYNEATGSVYDFEPSTLVTKFDY